jgi:hypothetical protein
MKIKPAEQRSNEISEKSVYEDNVLSLNFGQRVEERNLKIQTRFCIASLFLLEYEIPVT